MHVSGQGRLAVAGVMLVLPLGGCSGNETPPSVELPAAAALARAFEERAVAAGSDECFVLDRSGADAVLAALGAERPAGTTDYGFLQGEPGEDLHLSCGLGATLEETGTGDTEASVFVGLTPLDASAFQRQKVTEEHYEPIDGEAPGLNGEEVVGMTSPSVSLYAWVSDGVAVTLATGPKRGASTGFDALPVLLSEIVRTLGLDN